MTRLELDRVDARILLEAIASGAWATHQPLFLEGVPMEERMQRFERLRREVRAIAEKER